MNANLAPHDYNHARVETANPFDNLSLAQRVRRTLAGIGKPRDSGDYKFAKLQLQLLGGKLVSVCIVGAVIAALLSLKKPEMRVAAITATTEPTIITPTKLDPPPPPPVDPLTPPIPGPDISGIPTQTPTQNPEPSIATQLEPKPTICVFGPVKSIVAFRNMTGRTPGIINDAIRDRGGTPAGEGTVLRALRWLKAKQLPDGSWPGQPTAMTGLALLTFLAHGETPGTSEEFGATVERGLRYLTDNQKASGYFGNKDGNNYAHPIATYALCEAYSMTKVPFLKTAAERALRLIVNGQNQYGSWDYNMNAASDRSDTSYAGWCAQALKAGTIAGDLDVPGLDNAARKAVAGFKRNAHAGGGFGYTGKDRGGLTGVGILCMQLLGAANEPEVKKSLEFLDTATYSFADWRKQPYGGNSPVYYWYYITQAKFHAGGQRWTKWNSLFSPELVRTQIITPGAIDGPDGKRVDIGHWESPSEQEHHGGDGKALVAGDGGRVQDTCLSVLQLMVYYRYLPTFKAPDAADTAIVKDDTGEIRVDIVF